MRNQLSTLALLLLAGCAITGCSKSDSATPPSAPVIAPQAAAPSPKKLDNLALFNGKAPDGLVADATIGQSIRSVVPQAQFKCMSETFNYMPDLVLEGDGSLQATLSGSRAENWLMAYLSVNSSGLIDVVLRCPAEQQQMADAPFLYFTNRKLTDPTPKPVQDWFYVVGQESDLIKVSDSKVTNDIKFPDFMKGMLAAAASPKPSVPVAPVAPPPAPAQVTPPPATREQPAREAITYLRTGTVACGKAISLTSVQALEQMRARNPNIPLPPDCTTYGEEVVVNVLHYYQSPGAGNIAQVGNSGGTAFVRAKDYLNKPRFLGDSS